MLKQTGSSSVNILRQMLDLFSATQALINEMPSSMDPSSLMMLSVQLIDTICECLMGPNIKHQKELLNSNFFFDINRIFSSYYYVGGEPGHLKDAWDIKSHHNTNSSNNILEAANESKMNQLRYVLKASALKACLSMFDTVTHTHIPEAMLGFLDVRNLVSQTVSTSLLLGLGSPQQSLVSFHSMPNFKSSERSAWSSGPGTQPGADVTWCNSKDNYSHSFSSTTTTSTSKSSATTFKSFSNAATSEFQGVYVALRLEVMCFYRLLQYLRMYDTSGTVASLLAQFSNQHAAIAHYLQKHTRDVDISRVDIADDEEKSSQTCVQRVFFDVSEHMTAFVESTHFEQVWRDAIYSLPLDNADDKFIQLIETIQDAAAMSTWINYLDSTTSLMRFIIKRRDMIRSIPLYLSLIITVLLSVGYGIPIDPNTGYVVGGGRYHPAPWAPRASAGYSNAEEYEYANSTSDASKARLTKLVVHNTDLSLKFRLQMMSRWESDAEWEYYPPFRILMRLITVMHFLSCLVNLFCYLVLDFPLCLWKERRESGASHYHFLTRSFSVRGSTSELSTTTDPTHRKNLQNIPPPPRLDARPSSASLSRYTLVQRLLVKRQCWVGVYQAVLVCFALLGVVSSPFFSIACCLDYVRVSYERMGDAVVVSAPRVIRSFAMGFFFLVGCGFFTYAFYSQTPIQEDQSCHSPFQCVTKHVLDALNHDMTTVVGNVFAFAFPPMVIWEDAWYQGRSLYIVCGLFLFNMMLQPLMQGQIIDAFAEIRDKNSAKEEYHNSKCLITGLERHRFTKYPGEWEKRKGGAYALRYLLFFCSLLDRHASDYSGLENSVLESLVRSSLSFFPNGASSLESAQKHIECEAVHEDEVLKHDQEHISSYLISDICELRSEISDIRGMVQQQHAIMQQLLSRLERLDRPSVRDSDSSISPTLTLPQSIRSMTSSSFDF